jgi:lipoate-protein ligase A
MNNKLNDKFVYLDRAVIERVLDGASYNCAIYEAMHTEIVLGRSRKIEDDVLIDACIRDGIPILRRAGGGGTVVLSKGTIIISIAGKSSLPFHLREHLCGVNEIIIKILRRFNIKDLSIKGFSDIALGERKILGSSLYRRGEIVLYQGSLLFNPDLNLMNRYLKHPDREPEYRRGRIHTEFVTSIYEAGYKIDREKLLEALRTSFEKKSPWPPDIHN